MHLAEKISKNEQKLRILCIFCTFFSAESELCASDWERDNIRTRKESRKWKHKHKLGPNDPRKFYGTKTEKRWKWIKFWIPHHNINDHSQNSANASEYKSWV